MTMASCWTMSSLQAALPSFNGPSISLPITASKISVAQTQRSVSRGFPLRPQFSLTMRPFTGLTFRNPLQLRTGKNPLWFFSFFFFQISPAPDKSLSNEEFNFSFQNQSSPGSLDSSKMGRSGSP